MEAGFARMNDVTVIQASQGQLRSPALGRRHAYLPAGLCAYVLKHVDGARDRGVVVGHDHRHHSARFAQLTAGVFLRNGVRCYLLRGLVHTPLVVRHPGQIPDASS